MFDRNSTNLTFPFSNYEEISKSADWEELPAGLKQEAEIGMKRLNKTIHFNECFEKVLETNFWVHQVVRFWNPERKQTPADVKQKVERIKLNR